MRTPRDLSPFGLTAVTLTAALSATAALAAPLPPSEQQAILDKTITVHLAAPTGLSAGEQETVRHLLAVGEIFQRIYEDARHPQALATRTALDKKNASATQRTLYRLFQGPIATTLDNRREPFVDVSPETPGKNVYPSGITAEEVEAFFEPFPEARAEILAERTVVRRATGENLRRDVATLTRHPVIAGLHPGLEQRLLRLETRSAAESNPSVGERRLYAVPYALAWADEHVEAQKHLFAAADAIEPEDAEFARYLRNRGRDLLSNDYESGDASWVAGRFGKLNAQIGAYETYDDALFGVKAFPAVSVLVRDEAATAELTKSLGSLQDFENALPYEDPKLAKRVRSDVPVGVYDVVADFGQARGTNTATILPNDALFSRRYGRTILMRKNIIVHPDLSAIAARRWAAAVAPEHVAQLAAEGGFHRTLWHEIGHYLGPDRTADGRALDQALQSWADALEEMKADLVSLFVHERLGAQGALPAGRLQAVRASGILRTLQDQRPRKDQPYQVMQLAQFNWYLYQGLLTFDAEHRLRIDFTRYAKTVEGLLREVMALQRAGDPAKADAFFARWTTWTEDRHEALGQRMREAGGPRFRLVRYGALGE
jgi:hypothetical protein